MKIIHQTLTALLLFSISSCHYEKVNLVDQAEVIHKDSELFELITKMTNNSDDPLNNIECIRFDYSFYVWLYDENYDLVSQTLVDDNGQFSEVLSSVPDGHAISISYPIAAVLEDGTPYAIETNEDLKNAIDNCKEDEIFALCYAIASNCVWKIPYIENDANLYAGSILKITSSGLVTLMVNNETYHGSWVFLLNNDQVEANVHFSENEPIFNDWNFNFKVTELSDEKIIVEHEDSGITYTLSNHCESEDEYSIGDTGPENGIIAYKKDTFENGWQYIEADQQDGLVEEWGCIQGDIPASETGTIGNGWRASIAIANYHTSLDDYFNFPEVCDEENNGTVSALSALLTQGEDGEEYANWHLPTIDELELLYENLHLQGLGNFSDTLYWSATQADEENVLVINFATGEVIEIPKNSPDVKTRIIRYF